jgi:phage gpG-like protein
MRLVRGLRQADERLSRLDLGQVVADSLDSAARELESKVVDVLSMAPGQDHSAPWLQTGALRASISHHTDGMIAVVGSSCDVAVDQELGTKTDPPRSFLASTAAGAAEDLVAAIAASLARQLAER